MKYVIVCLLMRMSHGKIHAVKQMGKMSGVRPLSRQEGMGANAQIEDMSMCVGFQI